jgi:uncharacterized protein (DUF433 family)
MIAKSETGVIQRTSRGLSVAGTRLTLYTILDHLKAGWTPKLIRQWFHLSEEQMEGILHYVESHQADVEKEYAQVISEAETNRLYWESRNRRQSLTPSPLSAEQQVIWEKLQAWKKQIRGT